MAYAGKNITLIVAMDRLNTIGCDGQMPWHLPADLKHFKQTTMNHPVLMGRKTYDSIGRALPGRQNIVISRNTEFQAEGVVLADSLQSAITRAEHDEVMVIGGGEIYRQAMLIADRLVVTEVATEVVSGDTFFPSIDPGLWQLVAQREYKLDDKNAYDLLFKEYLRIEG